MRRVLSLSAWIATACMFDGDVKQDLATTPESLDDGWSIATPESVGLSAAALEGIHQELLREDRHLATLGFLVAKDGKLVFETYLRSMEDRDSYHHVQSVTKSVTSLVLALTRDAGYFPSLEVTLGDLFPSETAELEPNKRSITLSQMLTMRSGLEFDNDDFSLEMWVDEPSDPLRYILEKPMYAAPGERFYYRDADPQLVGYAMQRVTKQVEHLIARDRLFGPLGIRNYYWGTLTDGVSSAAHALHLLPRDMLKLGQLVLDRGRWHGMQIISPEAIDLITSPHATSDSMDRSGQPYPYGYYWWIVPDLGVTAWGHGGQFILVVPEKNLVLVQVSMSDGGLHGSQLNDFLDLVEPILR